MNSIEKFNRKLNNSEKVMRERLGANNLDTVMNALAGLEKIKKFKSWLPLPSIAGNSATGVGEGTLGMAEGIR